MGIQLKQNADGSMGLEGKAKNSGEFIPIHIPYIAGGPTVVSGLIATRDMQIQAISGVVDAAATNAVTATVYVAASGTALSGGTAAHSGTFNGQGTLNTNQTLTVTSGIVPAGSRIGIVWSGATGVAGAGVISVLCTPL